MPTPDEAAQELTQILSTPAGATKDEPKTTILLANRAYLDAKIDQEGQTPILMDAVKDQAGELLIRKYEKLTKPIWRKYRTKPECHPLHYICETPLWVVQDVNTVFLVPEDYQFLGAYFAQKNNVFAADQFFTESLKTGTVDAFINAGVFRYLMGERGVIDNFKVAKKHFNKALGIIHLAPNLTVDEKYRRRKLCEDAISEIDFEFASLFDKVFKFVIRLITFHIGATVKYVGPAAPNEPAEDKFQRMREVILKKEFDLKVEAIRKFVTNLQEKVPAAQSHLEEELHEIIAEAQNFSTPALLDMTTTRLGEFYVQNMGLLERKTKAGTDESRPEDAADETSGLYYELANEEEIDKVAAKYRLTSVGELVDMAAGASIGKPVVAWLLRDKLDERDIMQRLFKNPLLTEDMKAAIRRRHSLNID